MPQIPNGFSTEIVTLPIISTLGLLKRDNYDTFVKEFPDLANLGYITTAESTGALKYTPTHTFRHYVDQNKGLPGFRVVADATAAAGVEVSVTLTADSHELNGTKSPAAVGQIWENDADGKKYEVTQVTPVTNAFVVKLNPIKKAQVVSITASTAHFKFFGHVNVKEGSKKTQGIYKGYTPTEMETAIIRTDQEWTDLAAFETIVLDEDGGKYIEMQRSEEDERFLGSQELQLMFGEASDNLKSANNMNTNSVSLLEQIKAAGAVYNAPTAGVVDEDFFRGLKRRQSASGYTNEFHALLDTEATIKVDDFMAKYSDGGSIVYASFNGQKEVAINRNFGSYSIYNMTIHRKEYEYLNSARTHGADVNTGINKNSGLLIPQGSLTIDKQKFRHFNVRWQGENENSPIIRVLKGGGLFGHGTELIAEVGHATYKAIQAFQLQSYAYIRI